MTMASLNTISNGTPINATPVQANFATIAAYIDANVLNKDGSVVMDGTADLTLGRAPSSPLHAATKAYVDSLATTPIVIAAVTYTGATDTLALTDASQLLVYTNAAQVVVTIPLNAAVAFDVGTRIVLFSTGAGGLTLSTTGITLLAAAAPKVTIDEGEALYLEKTATNTWAVIGGTS